MRKVSYKQTSTKNAISSSPWYLNPISKR